MLIIRELNMFNVPDDVRSFLNTQISIFEDLSDKWAISFENDPQEARKYYGRLEQLYFSTIRPMKKTASFLYPYLEYVFKEIEVQLDSENEPIH